MTAQGMFDRVASHLLKQNAKALSESGDCRYRGERGLKCAIGALIPDELYDPRIEGGAPYTIARGPMQACDFELQKVLRASGISYALLDLADKLQNVHDHNEPSTWLAKLAGVAIDFKLDASVLRQV